MGGTPKIRRLLRQVRRSTLAACLTLSAGAAASAQDPPPVDEVFSSAPTPGLPAKGYEANIARDHPACAGLARIHYAMTEELKSLNQQIRAARSMEEQRPLVAALNELASQRKVIAGRINDCIRESSRAKRRPPLEGRVDKTGGDEGDAGPELEPIPPESDPDGDDPTEPGPGEIVVGDPGPRPVPGPPVDRPPVGVPPVTSTPTGDPGPPPRDRPTKPVEGHVEQDGEGGNDGSQASGRPGEPDTTGASDTAEDDLRCVFHYYYINGMNTPFAIAGAARGDYVEEYGLVEHFLVRYMEEEFGRNEEHHLMMGWTHNESGLDPKTRVDPALVGACLLVVPANERALCWDVNFSNCVRRGWDAQSMGGKPYLGELPPGDMIEVLQQGLQVAGWGVDYSLGTPLVRQVANEINEIHKLASNGPGASHQFVIVAHSQGNFFAEAIPLRLAELNPELLNHVAIFSLGSPTDYRRALAVLPRKQLATSTREDDLILSLNQPFGKAFLPLSQLLQNTGLATRPAPHNLPALWSLRTELFDTYQAGSPYMSFVQAVARCRVGIMGMPPDATGEDGLDIPLLDAHLMTNYLRPQPPRGGTPVLGTLRFRLIDLTQALCAHDHRPTNPLSHTVD